MKYLLQLPLKDPTGPAAVLMDRLYHRDPALLTGPPPTPFEHVHVQVSLDLPQISPRSPLHLP